MSAALLSQNSRLEELTARLEAAGAPQPDAPIVDLFPRGSQRAPGGETPRRVPADASYVIVVLSFPDASSEGRYVAELVDASGEVSWSGELRPSAYGTFRLGLPAGYLGGGEVRLFREPDGESGGERRLLEIYPLEIGGKEPP